MTMMRMMAFGAMLALTGGAAQAQQAGTATDSPPASSQSPASPEAGAGSTAGTAASTAVSDTEVRQFANAAVSVSKIQQDGNGTAAEKQTMVLAAVQQSGLSPQRFNEIAAASRSDPALMQRVRAAATMPGASPAPAAPATPGASGSPATPAEPGTAPQPSR